MGDLRYIDAGVDIDAGNRAVRLIKQAVSSTHTDGVLAGLGRFSGAFALPAGYKEPVLLSSTDSVGTKVKVAIAVNRHHGIGVDLVNHCVNDIITSGAEPLFFLDYFATGKLDPAVFAQLIEGMAQACRDAGCALLGGETAEMPGVYALGDYDLAGFIVGMVEERHHTNDAVRAGDVLVALRSSGLHTNGYSLARKVFEGVPLTDDIAAALMAPHLSYLDDMRRLPWKAAAHITGGGILGNLPRALPEGLAATIDKAAWKPNPIFGEIRRRGRVSDDEMWGTFNMGLGMILVTGPKDVPKDALVVGEVVQQSGPERVEIS